jgi:nitrate reductase beta subunit
MPEDWIAAAQKSPVYQLAKVHQVALPLHPEYRTMPMVWYVPPLSPVVDALAGSGHDGEAAGNLFGAIEALRIPIDYLAGLLSAGDPGPVDAALRRLAAMRSFMRDVNLGGEGDPSIPASVGMTVEQLQAMYRLLAIAKYEDRYVIPLAHAEQASALEESLEGCSLDVAGGPGMGQVSATGEVRPSPASVESFHLTRLRAEAERHSDLPESGSVDLLSWEGGQPPPGMFPPKKGGGDAG